MHVINGAFRTGAEASGWKQKSTLKGSQKILHNSPAHREDYTNITGSVKFPYYFCGTRWVDNKRVSDQLILSWENMIASSKICESLPKKKRPSSRSYVNVKKAVDDDLTVSKLSFFSYVASLMEPYLRKYQCDKPMIVFIFKDLKKMFLSLLRITVKDSVITGKTVQQLREIDLDKAENLIPLKDMNLGFATEALLKELQKKDVITAKQAKDFREEARMFVVPTLKKLIEKSPHASSFVRYAAVFDPATLSLESMRKPILKRFKSLLNLLLDLNILSATQCDQATQEFQTFMDEDVKMKTLAFSSFDEETTRLDHFYFKIIMVGRYEVLSFILKIIFTVSHEQASVERGFSLNDSVNQTNIATENVISKRLIKDYILANKIIVDKMDITRDMIKAYTKSHMLYVQHLVEEKKKKVLNEAEVQTSAISSDIDVLSQKRRQIKSAMQMMNDEFIECMKLAEQKNDMRVVIKGNRRKSESEDLQKELSVIEGQISDMQEKKRNLYQ